MNHKIDYNSDHLYPVTEALSVNYQEYLYKLLPKNMTPLELIHHQKLRQEAQKQLLCELADVFCRFLKEGTNSKGESLTGGGAPMFPVHRINRFTIDHLQNLGDPVFAVVDFVLPEPGVKLPKAKADV